MRKTHFGLKALTIRSSKLISKLSEDKSFIYISLFIYVKSQVIALSMRLTLFYRLSPKKNTRMGYFICEKTEKNGEKRRFTTEKSTATYYFL